MLHIFSYILTYILNFYFFHQVENTHFKVYFDYYVFLQNYKKPIIIFKYKLQNFCLYKYIGDEINKKLSFPLFFIKKCNIIDENDMNM